MDLYRYFHPHFNPRLRTKELRLQEIVELEQAAVEISKALRRASIRARTNPEELESAALLEQAANNSIELSTILEKLSTSHPGDSWESMGELLIERENAPGWGTWVKLLRQRLNTNGAYSEYSPLKRIKRKKNKQLSSQSEKPLLKKA